MKRALTTLMMAIVLAFIGLMGVVEPLASIVQLAFFSLLVVFVVQMVRVLVHCR